MSGRESLDRPPSRRWTAGAHRQGPAASGAGADQPERHKPEPEHGSEPPSLARHPAAMRPDVPGDAPPRVAHGDDACDWRLPAQGYLADVWKGHQEENWTQLVVNAGDDQGARQSVTMWRRLLSHPSASGQVARLGCFGEQPAVGAAGRARGEARRVHTMTEALCSLRELQMQDTHPRAFPGLCYQLGLCHRDAVPAWQALLTMDRLALAALRARASFVLRKTEGLAADEEDGEGEGEAEEDWACESTWDSPILQHSLSQLAIARQERGDSMIPTVTERQWLRVIRNELND